jgi:uncharacterized repeat protein (TIGR01451 family)
VIQSEPRIDLGIAKSDRPDPVQVDGVLTYTLRVVNNGPDTAKNVQVADPAPTGITFLQASSDKGTCQVDAALVSCELGSLEKGEGAAITIAARASKTGLVTNTATVTGSGGGEVNPADNTASTTTLVVAPAKPPESTSQQKPKPKPKPKPEPAPPVRTPTVCSTVNVTKKLLRATGKKQRFVVRVTAAGKPVDRANVRIKGPGVFKVVQTRRNGTVVVTLKPTRAGILTVSVRNKKSCNTQRIGVVGIFQPPVTG